MVARERCRNIGGAARHGLLAACAALAFACEAKVEPTGGGAKPADGSVVYPPATFVLATEPPGALSVKDLLKQAKDGEEVAAVGRVGDEVPGRAAFRLVDASITPCSEMEMPDACKTPWDYCCTSPDELRKVAASVELREGSSALKSNILGWNGLDHLKTVVVTGRVERDPAGNLTIAAKGVFVRK